MIINRSVACEQALCLGKNSKLFPLPSSTLDQRPVHRLIGRLLSFRRRITTSLRDGSTILWQPRVLDGVISIATSLPPCAF